MIKYYDTFLGELGNFLGDEVDIQLSRHLDEFPDIIYFFVEED